MTTADLSAALKKQPIVSGCLLVVIACALILYFRWGVIGESQAENDLRSKDAANVLNNVRNSANLPEQTAEMQAYAKELESRLIKASQLAVNLQYFYRLEAENQVKLVDVRQNPTRPSKSLYVSVPFSVTVQGTFAQVTNFLSKLQNGRALCRINSAVFNKAASATAGGPPEMTLVLSVELLGQS